MTPKYTAKDILFVVFGASFIEKLGAVSLFMMMYSIREMADTIYAIIIMTIYLMTYDLMFGRTLTTLFIALMVAKAGYKKRFLIPVVYWLSLPASMYISRWVVGRRLDARYLVLPKIHALASLELCMGLVSACLIGLWMYKYSKKQSQVDSGNR